MISAQTSTSKLLTTRLVEKVWGCDSLPAPFAMPLGQKIGEIWFEPPVELPSLLAKYLFTSEKLSVQVHPSTLIARLMWLWERVFLLTAGRMGC